MADTAPAGSGGDSLGLRAAGHIFISTFYWNPPIWALKSHMYYCLFVLISLIIIFNESSPLQGYNGDTNQ